MPIQGITQWGLRSHPTGSSTPETTTTTLSCFGSDKPVNSTAPVRMISPCLPTLAVAGPILSHYWNPYPTLSGRFYDIYGRLYPSVERPCGGLQAFWLIQTADFTSIVWNSRRYCYHWAPVPPATRL